MRAHKGAGVALDTFISIPGRDGYGHATFLESGGAGRHGTVGIGEEGAHREGIAILGVHHIGNLLDEFGSETALVRGFELGGNLGPFGRNLHAGVFATAIDGGIVHVHHVLALLAIALHDGVLHIFNGILVRDDSRDLEEGALEDGIGTSAQTDFRGDLGRVDDIEVQMLPADNGFHMVRDALDGLLLVPEAVQQQGAAILDTLEDIVLLQVGGNVAGHEVRSRYQVRSLDGQVTETQVRAGVTAGFLGIVVKVSLAVFGRMATDDLDGVLVGTHGTVGTQAIELALGGAFLHDGNLALDRERLEGNIVHDTDGEVLLGLFHLQVVEHGDDLGRRGVLGRQTIASTDDQRAVLLVLEEGFDIQIERFAKRSGLFRTIQYGNAFDALR